MGKNLGAYGEGIGKKYLLEKGYVILHSNYRTKLGELDIIAQKDNIIAFVEVKTRRNSSFGLPREAVDYRKQLTLTKIAQLYIQQKKPGNVDFRFDVIEVRWIDDKYEINHIENAF
ncbi:YraN family protein [Natronincola ferrireducens]|uniref:UPF0102 protein SAMN05660472_01312 n=1 Tax=Natronincola ferrireducens TaxID=393762 RepID=A0A1G9BZX6_9FIRM|nr:YraN family protein [Natronincola ferrireducens]SDK44754.1 putative endonuclease [Natronincola ferrireducens]